MNPLDRLEPLIAPAPVPFWPPAPGWWILAAAVPVLGMIVVLVWRRRRALSSLAETEPAIDTRRSVALAELACLQRPYGQQAGPWLQALNSLLKRLCVARYPETQCQRLSGRDWLAFLDTRCTAAGLTRYMILVQGAYRPDCRLDDKIIDGLYLAVDTWIRKHV